MKSKSTAAALALVLAGTGAHFFYLGQPILGWVWLSAFFFDLFLFNGDAWAVAVIVSFAFVGTSLIHGLWMAFMTEESFNAQYNGQLARCNCCGEVIRRTARKCKHCGEEFESTEPWVKPKQSVKQKPYDDSHLVH